MAYRIERREYSKRPWRLLDGDKEIYRLEVIGDGESRTCCYMPFAANTKAELVEMVLRQLEKLVDRVESMDNP